MKWNSLVPAATVLSGLYAAPTEHPVCIIGAGPAGLAAASRLESLGRSTKIFEQQDHVGGKNQALYRE
jgi:cation diffusion facilitator CzcD-associated flavoprotein CzcO